MSRVRNVKPHLISTIVAPGGRTMGFAHDGFGNLLGLTDMDGTGRGFGYTTPGNHLITSGNWAPYASAFTYSQGRLTGAAMGGVAALTLAPAVLEGLGSVAVTGSLAFDLAVVTDGRGGVTSLSLHPTYGWAMEQEQSLGVTMSWGRDTAGNLVQVVDGNSNATGYSYNASGGLVRVSQADAAFVSFSLDPTYQKVAQLVNSDGQTSSWAYDSGNGNLLSRIDGVGSSVAATTSYSWSGGLLTHEVDGENNTTFYSYDSNRRVTAQYVLSSASVVVASLAYAYTGAGFLASKTEGVGSSSALTTSYTHNGRGMLLSEVTSGGRTVSYSYTAAGFVASVLDSRGGVASYGYNAAGQQTAMGRGDIGVGASKGAGA